VGETSQCKAQKEKLRPLDERIASGHGGGAGGRSALNNNTEEGSAALRKRKPPVITRSNKGEQKGGKRCVKKGRQRAQSGHRDHLPLLGGKKNRKKKGNCCRVKTEKGKGGCDCIGASKMVWGDYKKLPRVTETVKNAWPRRLRTILEPLLRRKGGTMRRNTQSLQRCCLHTRIVGGQAQRCSTHSPPERKKLGQDHSCATPRVPRLAGEL